MLKTPASNKKRSPSLLKVFRKGSRDEGIAPTAPNTPEDGDNDNEDIEPGVTVVANEFDPTSVVAPIALPPSPLRGDHRSRSSKSGREEKKEENPSVPGEATVAEDVVSKTLNFFDDMCTIPQLSTDTSGVHSIAANSMIREQHPHLLSQESLFTSPSGGFDDNTTSPSLPSEYTGNSSVERSTRYSASYVSSQSPNNEATTAALPKPSSSAAPAHNHENFEVVLDPSSMATMEEKPGKPEKPARANKNRWKSISKSLASSLGSSSTKKDKHQPQNESNNRFLRERSGGSSRTPSAMELLDSPLPTTTDKENDEVPLDEEMGRLIASTDFDDIQQDETEAEKAAPEQRSKITVSSNNRESKPSTGVGGPKVLARKIWKKAKKIPNPIVKNNSRQKGEHKQQSHRAEVDSEAAVARSLEASRSLEEQEFLHQGSPKKSVEPILEENENDSEGDNQEASKKNSDGGDENSPMAKAWNNIFTSVSGEVCADTQAPSTPAKAVDAPEVSSVRDHAAKNQSFAAAAAATEEVVVPAGESVEVSSGQPSTPKKAQRRRTAPSLGRRLKEIQKSSYFKSKPKSTKTAGGNKNAQGKPGVAKQPSSSSLGSAAWERSSSTASDSNLPPKPRVIWKSVVDPNTGRTYYYHRKTRETTWTKPDGFKRYEIAYQRWLDAAATSGQASDGTEKEIVTIEETKEEEKSSETASSASSPRTMSTEPEGEKAGTVGMLRTTTPVVETYTMMPLQMSDSPDKETKTEPSTEEKAVAKTADVEEEIEKTVVTEKETTAAPADKSKTKQPFDESKPFDESTPFDEPLAETEPGFLNLPKSPPRFGRTMTYTSKASNRSALTDRTERIKNTGKGRFSGFNAISENLSTSTSISSHYDNTRGRLGSSAYRVPSRVPVVRERQLMVEELTDARLSAESYEGKSGERRGRIVRGRAREIEPTPDVLYDGDNDTLDDYGTSTYDNDTYGTDSVSALSENDTDFLSRRDNFDHARRRALDAAIEIEDWDLAAVLSDGMRAANLPGGYERAHSSWNQSELDKFIANNDWDAVKTYIARMREQSKKERGKGVSSRRKGQASSSTNKRVGSRSQIQHRELLSESSWSGSDSQSSYETYDSESDV